MDDTYIQTIQKFINLLLKPILDNDNVDFDVLREGDQWRINIKTDNDQAVIGEDGEMLHALQHLVRLLVHKVYPDDRTHFLVDVNFFRQNREKILKDKARAIAEEQVLDGGSTLIFVGLSSYERRIIHNLLLEIDGLETISVGQGQSRKLLIRPTSEVGAKGIDNAKVIDLFAE